MDMSRYKDKKDAQKKAVKAIEKGATYVHITGNTKTGYAVWSGKK